MHDYEGCGTALDYMTQTHQVCYCFKKIIVIILYIILKSNQHLLTSFHVLGRDPTMCFMPLYSYKYPIREILLLWLVS